MAPRPANAPLCIMYQKTRQTASLINRSHWRLFVIDIRRPPAPLVAPLTRPQPTASGFLRAGGSCWGPAGAWAWGERAPVASLIGQERISAFTLPRVVHFRLYLGFTRDFHLTFGSERFVAAPTIGTTRVARIASRGFSFTTGGALLSSFFYLYCRALEF
jgi:hypothetical protein